MNMLFWVGIATVFGAAMAVNGRTFLLRVMGLVMTIVSILIGMSFHESLPDNLGIALAAYFSGGLLVCSGIHLHMYFRRTQMDLTRRMIGWLAVFELLVGAGLRLFLFFWTMPR